MITVQTINYIIFLITGLIAYVPTVMLGGFFSAWIADKLGDDTAKNKGFLTLNFSNHIDFFYMMLTLIFMPYLGFTKPIPTNINNLNTTLSLKRLKIVSLFFIDAIGYMLVFALSVFLMKLFSINFLALGMQLSSFSIVIVQIFKMIFGLTFFFIIVHFFWSLTKLFIYFYFPEFEQNPYYSIFISVTSIILIMLFGSYIETFIILYKLSIDKLFNYLFL